MKTPSLHLIQSFLAFSQAKNMSAAADELGISQPALTSHLKSLEDCFPQDVFALLGRRKILTPFGLELKDLLSKRFSNLEKDLKTLTDQYESPNQVLVRIAGRGEILNYIAPRLKFSGHLHFYDMDGAAASDAVVERKYEIAISNHTARASSLHAKKLFNDQSVLLVPKKWISGRKRQLDSLLPFLLEKPLLAYKDSERALNALLKYHHLDQKISPHRAVSNWPSLVAMVELSQGWTVAPNRYKVGSQTISVPIPTDIVAEVQFYMLYRKESTSLPWFNDLLEEIRQASGQ